ncbi:phosphotransferase family protein [Natrinema sp. CBA1119]|uniref:phosphotransferase family protein n=1 Tax=Natrinema sp. CBA1119 TaxID=1608465 RepID=UPI000BF5709C|nr:phosphotransferase family protein [Natrinema sp. CBA1119]PGF17681.1 phosphotransferase family protein [Natrinema sp. CBA1119]
MGDNDRYLERLVDEEALRRYLEGSLGEPAHFTVLRHDEGHSNETLFVEWDDREFVIRRPPAGETADTAHDVLREYRTIDALQETAVPVPKTVLACTDDSIIGSEFYVMVREDGDVLRNDEIERFATPEHRTDIGTELVDALARIHAIDYEAVGLGDFGRPAGFTERQVDRWHRQLEWAFEVTESERAVPELETVGDWLRDNVPSDHAHALVHGDYKLDNVLFEPGVPPRLGAIFDWELSTLGDPLTDLGWMLLFWHDPSDPGPAMPELMSTFMARDGYPTRDELVDRYERQTGVAFENRRFYQVLAAYKMAGLGEMFFRRYLEGNSADPLYPAMEDGVPRLAEQTLAVIDGDQQL